MHMARGTWHVATWCSKRARVHVQARLDGAEYFHRTNDDIGYLSAMTLTLTLTPTLSLT